MARLLLAGLHLPGSGLTNVMAGLADGLGRSFDLDLVGFAPGAREDRDAIAGGRQLRVLGTPPRFFAARPDWHRDELARIDPDIVLVSGPGFMAAPFLTQLQPRRGAARLALYLPVEGELSGDTLGEVVGLVDHIFLYTRNALEGVAGLCARMTAQDPSFRAPALAVAGHGFDRAAFFPLADPAAPGDDDARRTWARRQVFPGRPGLDRAFIVLNANRIAYRKRLDLTLAAFTRFARGKEDVRLCLHTGRRAPWQEAGLSRDIAAAGIAGKVLLSPGPGEGILPEAALNLVYNACDIGLTTSSGEGWGLGSFEHAATGAAQIVPDHSSFRENWAGAAALVATESSEFIFYESTRMHAVSPDAAAAALERLYAEPRHRRALARAARRRALSPACRWPAVAARIAAALGAAGATASAGAGVAF